MGKTLTEGDVGVATGFVEAGDVFGDLVVEGEFAVVDQCHEYRGGEGLGGGGNGDDRVRGVAAEELLINGTAVDKHANGGPAKGKSGVGLLHDGREGREVVGGRGRERSQESE